MTFATLDRGLLGKAAIDTAKSEDRFGRLALAAAIGVEIGARALGFWDARVVGGKHRTWRVRFESTKSLDPDMNGAARERPRRLSARPDPPSGRP